MNCYSYVMGVSESIKKLEKEEFEVQCKEKNYMVTFPEDKADIWEKYISNELRKGFWNEYIGKNIVFIFKLEDGRVKKYILDDKNESEILNLCCEFAGCKFESIERMLKDNSFYNENYFSKL